MKTKQRPGRPNIAKGQPTYHVGFTINAELLVQFEKLQNKSGKKKSELFREILEFFLAESKRYPGATRTQSPSQ
jgi:metal-responsive CopG/Arc/MetJ family transcriptional regulator